VEKYCRSKQATDDNMAHARYMLVPKSTNTHTHTHIYTHTNTHTQNMYDTHRLSTASIVARTRLIVRLYVQFLTCLLDAWDGGYVYAMWRCAQKSTYFHVKSILLFSDSNTSGIRKQYFLEFFNIEVNENLFTSPSGACVHTDRRMDEPSEGPGRANEIGRVHM
jgi:hypothetical protein